MALILLLETSARNCSVALSSDGSVLFSKIDADGPSHAVKLGIFVDEALKVAEDRGRKIDAVAVSSGPGSYTGLRIGVSLAKGVCYGAGVPLIAIPTLDMLADAVSRKTDLPENALICPMVDARRMEIYTAIYNAKGETIQPASALIVEEQSFSTELAEHPVWFVGDGAAKCRSAIVSDNAHFELEAEPTAESMIPLAEAFYQLNQFEDVAYFEPFYLKEFVATVSKKQRIPTV
jgi:tRNA threonylcarbamoyladenosine biosynthesis protein TsaB